MDQVIKLAERLGKAIAETDRFTKLREVEKATRDDSDAQKALAEMESFQQEIARKEADGSPIEPEEKRRLADLRTKVHTNAGLQGLARAQADYMELMSRVNGTIREQLGVDEDED